MNEPPPWAIRPGFISCFASPAWVQASPDCINQSGGGSANRKRRVETMNNRTIPTVVAILLAATMAAGCSADYTSSAAGRAEEALDIALRTWHRGEAAKKLKEKSIEMIDPDWNLGSKLVGFLLAGTETAGGKQRCTVSLAIQDGAGNPLDKAVTYEITVQDKIFIRRVVPGTGVK